MSFSVKEKVTHGKAGGDGGVGEGVVPRRPGHSSVPLWSDREPRSDSLLQQRREKNDNRKKKVVYKRSELCDWYQRLQAQNNAIIKLHYTQLQKSNLIGQEEFWDITTETVLPFLLKCITPLYCMYTQIDTAWKKKTLKCQINNKLIISCLNLLNSLKASRSPSCKSNNTLEVVYLSIVMLYIRADAQHNTAPSVIITGEHNTNSVVITAD